MADFKPEINKIAFIGNYFPRKCGIATFTTHLAEAIAERYPETSSLVVAMNDQEEGYQYLPRVQFEVPESDILSYRVAADYLNLHDVDVVSLQHEYGIFGGQAGSYILHMLRELRMPVVTTLHTVLKEPDAAQMKVLKEIARLSSRLVVMSELGRDMLTSIYKVPAEKIDFIHHGIPDVPFVDPNFYKDHFNVEGRIVLLTFGLLSRNKGIENVIKALPAMIEKYPDIVYIVLGATHPNVLASEGESYRESLQDLAQTLGVSDHVIFENRFVSQGELIEYIGAADIYITPYLNPRQITSGTLAYTVGAGKAVISTPYWYAEEILKDGRGLLVPFGEPDAISNQVIFLLENEAERHAMRKRAYIYGRDMIWQTVAENYLQSFECARQEPVTRLFPMVAFPSADEAGVRLPPANFAHLQRMTDQTGMLQHAIHALPNYAEGYTTDDNSRALIATVLAENSPFINQADLEPLQERYLSFLWYAYNREDQHFRNFLSYGRTWLEKSGSDDSNGRALWGLGITSAYSRSGTFQDSAAALFTEALPIASALRNPRSWAFSLLGINAYLERFPGDRSAQAVQGTLAGRLVDLYTANSSDAWQWFEDQLTYCNARLPQALIQVGAAMGNQEMVDTGLKTLTWLTRQTTSPQGYFSPIGSNGWYVHDQERAHFDQQPVEACDMVSASLTARRISSDTAWMDEAWRAFNWFTGANVLGLSLYDSATGGCQDGLHPDRVNQNQGAESTLSWLISLLEMHASQPLWEAESLSPRREEPVPSQHDVSGRRNG